MTTPEQKKIYIIKSEAGPVKVGIAEDPQERLKALTRCQPFDASLCHAAEVENPELVEKAAHHLLNEKHRRGEWFDISLEEATAAVAEAVKLVDNGWTREGRREINLRCTLLTKEIELLSYAADAADIPLATWARSTLLQAARAVKQARERGEE
jgi:hypothetical protein